MALSGLVGERTTNTQRQQLVGELGHETAFGDPALVCRKGQVWGPKNAILVRTVLGGIHIKDFQVTSRSTSCQLVSVGAQGVHGESSPRQVPPLTCARESLWQVFGWLCGGFLFVWLLWQLQQHDPVLQPHEPAFPTAKEPSSSSPVHRRRPLPHPPRIQGRLQTCSRCCRAGIPPQRRRSCSSFTT